MIRSRKIDPQPLDELIYPYLGETCPSNAKSTDRIVVLFHAEQIGVVIYSTVSRYPVGLLKHNWCEDKFRYCTDEFIISNRNF